MNLSIRMQWDIPFINNIDVDLLIYLANQLDNSVVIFIESIYQFKPIKFAPFVIMFCWLWYRLDKADTRKRIIATVLYGFISLVLCRILSFTVPFRPRPTSSPVVQDTLTSIPTDGWSSFPSDHGVFSFAMAYGLFKIKPIYGVLFGLYSLIVICVPRAILHIHYPSDLLAGALLGLCFAYLLSKFKPLNQLTNYLYDLSKIRPVIFYGLSAILLFEFIEMFETPRKLVFMLHDVIKTII